MHYTNDFLSPFESFTNRVQTFIPMGSSFDDLVEHVCFDLSMPTEMIPLDPLSSVSHTPSHDDSNDKCIEKLLEDLEIFFLHNLSENKSLLIHSNQCSSINIRDDDIQAIWSEWTES